MSSVGDVVEVIILVGVIGMGVIPLLLLYFGNWKIR